MDNKEELFKILRHCDIHGTGQLEKDLATINNLIEQLQPILESYAEVDQNFQWSDELYEPRKSVWMNLYGSIMDLEEASERYKKMITLSKTAEILNQLANPEPA